MTTRTSKQTVTFQHPFRLFGLQEEQPAGAYLVEFDEELMQGVSFTAFRRTRVLVHLRRSEARPGISESLWIDPSDLDAALSRDAAADLAARIKAPNA
tara:strand:- start:48 stop:341 length:294 start_codon:yes stop_codon:yes gene_type:complete